MGKTSTALLLKFVTAVAVYGVLIAVGEFFFHQYLANTATIKT